MTWYHHGDGRRGGGGGGGKRLRVTHDVQQSRAVAGIAPSALTVRGGRGAWQGGRKTVEATVSLQERKKETGQYAAQAVRKEQAKEGWRWKISYGV